MLSDDVVCDRARRLAKAVEPFAAQYIFSPECHEAYQALGFGPSPRRTSGGVAFPEGISYLLARSAPLGRPPGEVVAATFAAFNPALVVPGVAIGWTMVEPEAIAKARDEGSVGQLRRILGPEPEGLHRANELLATAIEPLPLEGRPLFAGLRARGPIGDPLGDAWRRADMLREFRGDSHIAAYISRGLTSAEVTTLTEAWWGIPLRSYSPTRLWSADELDATIAALRDRGLLDGDELTDAGRALREDVERATDLQLRPAMDALGDRADELIATLGAWSRAVIEGKGYLAGGAAELGS